MREPHPVQQALSHWFTPAVRRRLSLYLVVSLALPWLAGEWAKQFVQPGLHQDPQRMALLIDYMVLGAIAFGLSMVLTWLIGTWITAVMKGRQYLGDEFPATSHQPSPRDDDSSLRR
ncbi:hypothetical protein RQP53_21180 [Paucibacter sp. APW11]|uniref:Poly-beta-1,6-N-acetyl-D-glucosamine biosynthesis protein PgaD n=1 Tax=Roseateles aquae TaxID=3077235 RepID=A0ABU3PGZ8_9BURK|nr:hypothetical protein [Paucibacter sp. APW11]MDT9001803.1 hypothetical protein [Paucibacter sp. APW11]